MNNKNERYDLARASFFGIKKSVIGKTLFTCDMGFTSIMKGW